MATFRLRLCRAALLAVIIAAVLGRAPAAMAAPAQHRLAGSEPAQLLELINADRAGAGVAALGWRDDVSVIALGWSAQMAATGTLSHNDFYFSDATRLLIGSSARGENVAFSGTMEATHWAFMHSAGHRANILDPRFTAVGIAVVHDLNGTSWVTEDFLQEAGAPAPAPEPAPAPQPEPEPEPQAAAEQTITAAAAAAPTPVAVTTAPPSPEPTTAPSTTAPPTTTASTSAPAPLTAAAPAPLDSSAPDSPIGWTALVAGALITIDLVGLRLTRSYRRRA
jgi:hypothetical protein